MNIEEKVKNILSELSGDTNIKKNTTLQGDLALDSLLMVTMLVELEDEFKFELEESDMNPYELVSVQDVINLVCKYCCDSN